MNWSPVGNVPGINVHQPGVRATGFEHECGSRCSAIVDVHGGLDPGRPWVVVDKDLRAEQPELFSVCDEQHDRMDRRRP